jgi:hypothetical protein
MRLISNHPSSWWDGMGIGRPRLPGVRAQDKRFSLRILDDESVSLPSVSEGFLQDSLAKETLQESSNPLLILLVDDEIPCALRKGGLGLNDLIQGRDSVVGIEAVSSGTRVSKLV